MPWKVSGPMEERLAFVHAYRSGLYTMSDLCRRFDISRQNGYKWLARYQAEGLDRRVRATGDTSTVFSSAVHGDPATPLLEAFALLLEKVCVDTVESGKMTKDLATLIRPDHPYLTTDEFMDAIDAELKRRMA